MSLRQLWHAWDNFWFANDSPVPIALFRVFLGLLVLQFCWGIWADLQSFFGKDAIVAPLTSAKWFGPAKIDLFSHLPAGDSWLFAMYWLLVLAGIFLTLGIFSRATALVTYLLLISFQSLNNLALYNIAELLYLMAFWLLFSRCGDALSVDRLARIWLSKKPETGPASSGSVIGQRLIQVQIILIYWGAFSSKLQGETWMDGTAIYYAVHSLLFQQLQIPHLAILDELWFCRVLSWSTLVLEFMLVTLIWVKEFRYPVLFLGLCFHIAMEFTLSIPLLQPIMLATYVTFIDSRDLSKVMDSIKRLSARLVGTPFVVAYDDGKDRSRRMAETIRRLDVLGLVRLEPVT